MKIQFHVPRDGNHKTADIVIEQELSGHTCTPLPAWSPGVDIISIKDITKPQTLWQWRIEKPSFTRAPAANPIYLKSARPLLLDHGIPVSEGGPIPSWGHRIRFDWTPDTSKIKEVARIMKKSSPAGSRVPVYKHSDGRRCCSRRPVPLRPMCGTRQSRAGGDPANCVPSVPWADASISDRRVDPALGRTRTVRPPRRLPRLLDPVTDPLTSATSSMARAPAGSGYTT